MASVCIQLTYVQEILRYFNESCGLNRYILLRHISSCCKPNTFLCDMLGIERGYSHPVFRECAHRNPRKIYEYLEQMLVENSLLFQDLRTTTPFICLF